MKRKKVKKEEAWEKEERGRHRSMQREKKIKRKTNIQPLR